MNVRGDIQVWIEGDKAHARIVANGPGGPIFLQASAPLAAVRAHVMRLVRARGVNVSGMGGSTDDLVGLFGRRMALRRLAKVAPVLFQPGGVAQHLAVQAMRKRRRGKRRRVLPAAPTQRALPEPEPEPEEEEAMEPMETDDEVEGIGYVGANLQAKPASTRKVKAGLVLLSAAKTNPTARRKVRSIVELATRGVPQAQAALQALKVADQIRKGDGHKPLKKAHARKAALAAVTPRKPVGPAPETRPAARSKFFSSWQKGVE